jgi:prevent-host-death family protein
MITALAGSRDLAKMARLSTHTCDPEMISLSAKDAKYSFGRMIDLARAAPVMIEKHGRPVVVVMALEEFERLKGLELQAAGLSESIQKSLAFKKTE